jgi:hypothetical protein
LVRAPDRRAVSLFSLMGGTGLRGAMRRTLEVAVKLDGCAGPVRLRRMRSVALAVAGVVRVMAGPFGEV